MSSEQVIAEVVAEMRSRYASATGHGASHEVVAANAVDVAAMLTRWADRLSTPAAGGAVAQDGERRAWVGVQKIDAEDNCGYIEHCADQLVQSGYNITARVLRSIADDYRQLQARNAERAADLKEWREAAQQGARVAERCLERLKAKDAKLTALLDGIEGLEADLRARERFRNDIADDLKALREKANGSQGERGDA